ncbi:MAG: hypothetical protein FWD81_03015 [Methanomassiliicoccaceae archaeon]|nr:hypothetical protein [Methanomassiliicoccaceae archaeon]
MVSFARVGKVLQGTRKWDNTFLLTVGITIMVAGIIMLIPLITALIYGDDLLPFLIPMTLCICVSAPMLLLFGFSRDLRPVDGFLLIVAVWGVVTAIAAVPFFLSGWSIIDGFFESVSGFTTTGATLISPEDFESCPNSLLLWRSLTQWIGGIAIILIFIALLPMLGFGGRSMFKNEVSGSGGKNLTTRMTDAALQFIIVYAVLSAVFLVAVLLMGVDPFDSVCLMFSTISTGGFMTHDNGTGVYPSYVQMVILAFMFLGATNFYLHYQRIYRKKGAGYLKNSEFKWMVLIFAIASVAIFVLTFTSTGTNALTHAKDVVFTVVSIGSSTGYMVTDIGPWALGAAGILLILVVIGGSSGSTAGGLKVGRASAIVTYLMVDVRRRLHPRGVFETKVGGETLEEGTIQAAYLLFVLFVITMVGGGVVLMVLEPGMNLEQSMILSVTSVTNCGFVGPFGHGEGFTSMSDASKLFTTMLMWIGRLEIGTALMLLTPFFWKEVMRGRRWRGIAKGVRGRSP